MDFSSRLIDTYERLTDLRDIAILKSFYMGGRNADQLGYWCPSLLYKELKTKKKINNISYSRFWHIVDNFAKRGLIQKIEKSNPSIYEPIPDLVGIIREMIISKLKRW